MYERFTDRSRRVLQLANQEAQRFNHEYIGTEHILLGLVKEGNGVAAAVLKNLDIDLRKIRLEVERLVQCGPDMVVIGKLPQTPRAKKVIEYSMEEARSMNHNYVGTEHLLLGLLRENGGIGAQVLQNLGLNLNEVKNEVYNLLGQSSRTSHPIVEASQPKQVKQNDIAELQRQKDEAVQNLDFQTAAMLRDRMTELQKQNQGKRQKVIYQIACIVADCIQGNLGAQTALDSISEIITEYKQNK